ncbi:YchJ family metal-binding protein [Polaromonas sp.]|uniref:YchJ family protein n=1 Tax=Polaromonas sp. TaxID=1869339 RepID=UPI002489AC84|nr:YchJ family metal-binding protein [Polaromonas sp.]MDI1338804.1 YchJ family metal-binding protein [Polaromonas sp.]
MAACPCGRADARGRPLAYATCCARYLERDTPAPDAEALMRSRYSAFVLERADHLLATWHTSHRPPAIDFDPGVKWLGLDVRQHRPLDDSHAEVEFVARQKSPGSPAVRLHERSRFVREAGRWYYVDGDQL